MGLQDRTTDLNSRGTKKKSSERLSEVLASRTQENKTKVSKVMLGNFFPIKYFKMYSFLCLSFYRYKRVKRKSLLSRECYMHEHQRIVCLYLSPRIHWKWTRLHRYLIHLFWNHFHQKGKHYHICETYFTSIPCIDPFTPEISLVIRLTVYHTILMMLVLRIWYWINW